MRNRIHICFCLVLSFILLLVSSGCQRKDETEEPPYVQEEAIPETETVFKLKPEEHMESDDTDTDTKMADETEQNQEAHTEEKEWDGMLASEEEIGLSNPTGDGKNYVFTYVGEVFQAIYTPDNWKIIDSNRIKNEQDILLISQALLNTHPIHGADGESYRTPEDLAFEWLQHNLAYELLPEDNTWRKNAKDVDLNPSDQWKTIDEIYEDRTGEKFDPTRFLE